MVGAGTTPGHVDEKPVVKIMTTENGLPSLLDEILTGLEEEGIPAEHQETTHGRAVILAKSACLASRLNVGIGVDWEEGQAALTHRDLPPEKPLLILAREKFSPLGLHLLGINAARLVKGEPLVLGERKTESRRIEAASGSGPAPPPKDPAPDRAAVLDELVALVMAEIMGRNKRTSG